MNQTLLAGLVGTCCAGPLLIAGVCGAFFWLMTRGEQRLLMDRWRQRVQRREHARVPRREKGAERHATVS